MTNLIELQDGKTEEGPDGVFRTTLSYGAEAMLCHFTARQGATIPLHNHPAVQSGFCIKARCASGAARATIGSSPPPEPATSSARTNSMARRCSRTASSSRCSLRCVRSTRLRDRVTGTVPGSTRRPDDAGAAPVHEAAFAPIAQHCRVIGLTPCGVLAARHDLGAEARYRRWLAQGRHGSMAYLERHAPFKADPGRCCPAAAAC